jgi:hypothetical protein
MKSKNVWDIESIADIEIPEVFMENAKMGIARIQFESLKVKELQKLNEKLDKLIEVMTPVTAKAVLKPSLKGDDK